METHDKEAQVFELIEMYDFDDLSPADKEIVLSVMTEKEYTQMRKSVSGIETAFEHSIEPPLTFAHPKTKRQSFISKLINYPLKSYQVAASIAVIFGCYFLLQKTDEGMIDDVVAHSDTIMIHKVDTLHSNVHYTVEIVKELEETVEEKQIDVGSGSPEGAAHMVAANQECETQICPHELESITTLNNRNSITNDTELMGLLGLLN